MPLIKASFPSLCAAPRSCPLRSPCWTYGTLSIPTRAWNLASTKIKHGQEQETGDFPTSYCLDKDSLAFPGAGTKRNDTFARTAVLPSALLSICARHVCDVHWMNNAGTHGRTPLDQLFLVSDSHSEPCTENAHLGRIYRALDSVWTSEFRREYVLLSPA